MRGLETIEEWANKSPENKKAMVEETFILNVTESIWYWATIHGMNVKDLADGVGISLDRMRDLLSGEEELTLRMVADIAISIGVSPEDIMEKAIKS